MAEIERAKQLADDHWNGYVSRLVGMHSGCYSGKFYTHEEMMALCEFHYKTAIVHGYGHGAEDQRNGLLKEKRDNSCATCMDNIKCYGGKRMTNGDCLHYRGRNNS